MYKQDDGIDTHDVLLSSRFMHQGGAQTGKDEPIDTRSVCHRLPAFLLHLRKNRDVLIHLFNCYYWLSFSFQRANARSQAAVVDECSLRVMTALVRIGSEPSKKIAAPQTIVGAGPQSAPRAPPTSGPTPSMPRTSVRVVAFTRPCRRLGISFCRTLMTFTL